MATANTTGVASYRRAALEVGNDPTHPRHLLPQVPTGAHRILDVGCHAGHILEALKLPQYCEVFGCDINPEALELAKKCLPHVNFSLGKAEDLPYEDSYFDFVFARAVVLAFDIPKALVEFNRVLKPGGRLWISLYRWKDVRHVLKGTLRSEPLKTLLFAVYVAVNSALFHYTGRMIRYPLNRSRIMSFQTEKRMRREFQKAGFSAIKVSAGSYLVIEADRIGSLVQLPGPVQHLPVSQSS